MTDEAEGKDDVIPLPPGCKAALLDGAWSCARCGTSRAMDSVHPGCKPLSLSRLVSIMRAVQERAYQEYQSLHGIKTSGQSDPAIAAGVNPWPRAVLAAELAGVVLFLERCADGDQRAIDALLAIQKKAKGETR